MKKILKQVVDKLRNLRIRIQNSVDKLRNLRIQDRIVLLLYSIMMVLVYIGNGWFKEKELQSTSLTLPERILEYALNLLKSRPINAAGNIPASDNTEYRPPIKFLCSIISALYLFPILAKQLSIISVIIINLFFSKVFENTVPRFVIVSRVLPDFETTIKQELFIFLIFLYFKFKFESRLSKKNTSFLIFF